MHAPRLARQPSPAALFSCRRSSLRVSHWCVGDPAEPRPVVRSVVREEYKSAEPLAGTSPAFHRGCVDSAGCCAGLPFGSIVPDMPRRRPSSKRLLAVRHRARC
eukprot:scaffold38_cov415-Prasinococcus_capsulatus_cf.AAC.7